MINRRWFSAAGHTGIPAGRLRGDEAGSFVRCLNGHSGSQFTFLGMAELGETNAAAYVQWPDGRHSVLTRTRYPIEHLTRIAEILELIRAAGIPAPRYELIVQVHSWTVVIQERLPGSPLAGGHIDLPMMDGFYLIQRLRDHEIRGNLTPSIAIALTGHDGDEYRLRSIGEGFHHFMTKPAHPDALVTLIQQSLSSRELS